MATARGSGLTIKSKGDRGQPCLVRLLRGNDVETWEAICTWDVGGEYSAFKACINGPEKPCLDNVANINDQFKRSNAF